MNAYKDTMVDVGKSQAQIRKILYQYSMQSIQFEDDYIRNMVSVRFIRIINGVHYIVRISSGIPNVSPIGYRGKKKVP